MDLGSVAEIIQGIILVLLFVSIFILEKRIDKLEKREKKELE